MIDRDDMPARIQRLPVDPRGYPIPRFVAYVDGKPDFRVIDNDHWARCVQHRRCWICGETLGRHVAFVCGPSSAVNGVTSEPGSHLDCAQYALRICPFILFPNRRRDACPLGIERSQTTVMIERNPGVWALWVTHKYKYKPFSIGDTVRIRLGPPSSLTWWRQAKPASTFDVAEGIKSAIDALPGDAAAARQMFFDFLRKLTP